MLVVGTVGGSAALPYLEHPPASRHGNGIDIGVLQGAKGRFHIRRRPIRHQIHLEARQLCDHVEDIDCIARPPLASRFRRVKRPDRFVAECRHGHAELPADAAMLDVVHDELSAPGDPPVSAGFRHGMRVQRCVLSGPT